MRLSSRERKRDMRFIYRAMKLKRPPLSSDAYEVLCVIQDAHLFVPAEFLPLSTGSLKCVFADWNPVRLSEAINELDTKGYIKQVLPQAVAN